MPPSRAPSLLRTAALVLVAVAAVGVAVRYAFDEAQAGSVRALGALGAAYTLVLVVAAVAGSGKDTFEPRFWLRPQWGDISRGFFAAVALFGAAYAFVRVVAPPTSPRSAWVARVYLQAGDTKLLREHLGLVALVIVAAATCEELVWRGWVTAELERVIGERWAWVGAAGAYALAHAPTVLALRDPTAGINPTIVLAALAGGLLWGGMQKRFGRLVPGIFAHAIFDWAVLMTYRLWGPSV